MKTSKFATLAAVLALSALALAGCNKGATGNANSNANSNTAAGANKNTATTTASNAGSGDYSSPTNTIKSFYDAAKNNNLAALKSALSAKTLSVIEKGAAKDNKSVDDALKDIVKDAPSTAPEVRNEKIDGDKATVEVKDDKMDKWETMPLVKESGQWKIAILDEMAGAMDKLDSLDKGKK